MIPTILPLMQILTAVSAVLNVILTFQHFSWLLNIRKINIQNDKDDQSKKKYLQTPLTIFQLHLHMMFEF